MKKKVFIDGSAGTTGLRIYERLGQRDDIQLVTLPDEIRKDADARKQALNSADIAFLCLPDTASIEAVSMLENEHTVIIDTSTAHRTNSNWCYGFPELSAENAERIRTAKRIAVPGCHASGFIALVEPLVSNGFISPDALLTVHSLTGYSGGAKGMIAEYESDDRDGLLGAPRQYALSQSHKHLREMKAISGLNNEPIFSPIVADFYSGMEVTVPLFKSQLNGQTIDDVKQLYREKYCGELVKYVDSADEGGFLSAAALSGKDSMQISVYGNDERIILVARYDNLGKGASGAAVQCLNIVLGADPRTGLEL
jgi:N-acetyl-gamma-glutamyl-phosphate reductase